MKTLKWLRISLFIVGVVGVLLLLILGNINTKRIVVSPNDLIQFETLGDKIYLLEPEWQIETIGDQKVYTTTIRFSTTDTYSGIYVPRAQDVTFTVNHSTENIIEGNEHFVYLLAPLQKEQTISIELRLPLSSYELFSAAQLYIGNYTSIMLDDYRESNLRLFTVGLSFTIILFSMSLYFQKPSEKYLLLLALLAYSTFGYVLLKVYPTLQEHFWTSLLFMGPVKLPFVSSVTSSLLYRLGFPLLVGYLNYLLLKTYISVKIFNVNYYIFVVPVCLLFFIIIEIWGYFLLISLFHIFINLLESIVIIKGSYRNKSNSIALLAGAAGTIALNIFIAGCGMTIIPHGDVDLLFQLGGISASIYPIVFTVAINGIFAGKYAEAEVLSDELNSLNQNLQRIVDEKTSALKTANAHLEKEQQQKDVFITSMVHSLKTPLFSIAGFADMAQEALQSMPEKASHYIGLISTNTDIVVKLVNNLFLALRLEYNKVNFMIEKVNLCMMIDQIYNTTLPHSQQKDIQIIRDVPHCPVLIECDLYYLSLALQNIVDNAVRHTAMGGEIRLSLVDLEESVEIGVKDNGEGISAEVIRRIFDRYYSHSSQGHESSGLGLTISMDVITALHGQIEVSSVEKEGTEFKIVLPKATPQPA